jgi:uncharacterized protein (DUF111 family)
MKYLINPKRVPVLVEDLSEGDTVLVQVTGSYYIRRSPRQAVVLKRTPKTVVVRAPHMSLRIQDNTRGVYLYKSTPEWDQHLEAVRNVTDVLSRIHKVGGLADYVLRRERMPSMPSKVEAALQILEEWLKEDEV